VPRTPTRRPKTALLEALEARRFLAANASVSTPTSFPTAVPIGQTLFYTQPVTFNGYPTNVPYFLSYEVIDSHDNVVLSNSYPFVPGAPDSIDGPALVSVNNAITFNPNAAAGTFRIRTTISVAGDSDPSDNVAYSPSFVLAQPFPPQITILAPTALPTAIAAGESLAFMQHVTLQGYYAKPQATISYALVDDQNQTISLPGNFSIDLNFTATLTSVISSFSTDSPFSVTVPSTVSPGNYRLQSTLFTDGTNILGDHVSLSPSFTILPPPVDFSLPYLAAPSAISPGSSFVIQNAITIAGTMTKTTTVRYYLSQDAALDAGDRILATRTLSVHAAGTALTLSPYQVPVSNTLADGTYYLIAAVDPTNVTDESNETNNTVVSDPIYVHAAAAITPENLNLSLSAPLTVTRSANARLILSAANPGSTPMNRTYAVRYFLSDDTILSPDDTQVAAESLKFNLPNRKPRAFPLNFKVPANSSLGTKHLIAVGDSAPNASDSSHFEITPTTTTIVTAPHLTASILSITPKGKKTQVAIEILNTGTAPSTSLFTLKLFNNSTLLLTARRTLHINPNDSSTLTLLLPGSPSLDSLSVTLT
jgi:hypothetical protein